MIIDLFSESTLGHWDVSPSISQCEYQFGQTLIYVQHPKDESHLRHISKAQGSVAAVWSDIENAVCFAEHLSRKLIPEFWHAHDESGRPGLRLNVYSIHYDLDAPYPTYTVGTNHDFDFEYTVYADDDLWKENGLTVELPEPPDNFWLSIRRIGINQFEGAAQPTNTITRTNAIP